MTKHQNLPRHVRTDEQGVVLVICLALIVLITFAVVAYFSRTMSNRRIEHATSSAVRADTLAVAAAEIVVADVRTEIVSGSDPAPTSRGPFVPTSAAHMVPARTLAAATMLSNPNFNGLVKQSTSRFFPVGGYSAAPMIATATTSDTTLPSANGRTVSVARWNTPALNSGSGFTSSAECPHWLLIDREGIAPSQVWSTDYANYAPGNARAVIGRFAFNVYDVGGLLDANVAGHPVFSTPLTDAQIQQLKSTESGATFYNHTSGASIIPGFGAASQSNFVNQWRFSSTSGSSANFFLDFMSRTIPWNLASPPVPPTFADSGFMRPTVAPDRATNRVTPSSSSNTGAYTRQDLLRLTHASGNYMPVAALPYFTHFSREVNSPSWTPSQDASSLGGDDAGGTYAYFTNRNEGTATNRNVLGVTVQRSFTRADGTTAAVGEPLLKYRFSLRKLDGVGSTGVNTTGFPVVTAGVVQGPDSTSVQRDFGLVWNALRGNWDYAGYSGTTVQTTIATLDTVAANGREPNFFEILKAFILSGSTGVGSGPANTVGISEQKYFVTGTAPTNGLSADAQIIQIGANIIDQWDSDRIPTFIQFAGEDFAGVENLAYLNKLLFQPRWSTTTPSTFGAWLMPSFWMPAQNGTTLGTAAGTPRVRFIMTSGTASAVIEGGGTSAASAVVSGSATQPSAELVTTATFGPVPATPSTASTTVGMTPSAPSGKVGVPFIFASTGGVTSATTTRTYPILTDATFEMQAQVNGVWKTYQRWRQCNVNRTAVTSACQPTAPFTWTSASIFDPEFVVLDPRTMRFGVWETNGSGTAEASDFNRGFNETLDRATVGFQRITSLGPQGTHFTGAGAEMANNNATTPSYTDLDGVRRRADVLNVADTSALLPTNVSDRPPSVSRQIRTVGELGTVFRDQPWKTINFTTSDSADAALLDAFSIFEPNSIFRSDIIAGKVSLNTRQPEVLRAILDGVTANTNGTLVVISETQRDSIVDALINLTTTQPFINKSELVTRLADRPAVSGLGSKEAREAVIRAFSDVGQTRTWNLTIDVVAQSGRYAAGSSSVDNFIVEGEKRYWLHVAIDRFTGEVVDQQLEPVYE